PRGGRPAPDGRGASAPGRAEQAPASLPLLASGSERAGPSRFGRSVVARAVPGVIGSRGRGGPLRPPRPPSASSYFVSTLSLPSWLTMSFLIVFSASLIDVDGFWTIFPVASLIALP